MLWNIDDVNKGMLLFQYISIHITQLVENTFTAYLQRQAQVRLATTENVQFEQISVLFSLQNVEKIK